MKDPGVLGIEGEPGRTSLTLLDKVRSQDREAWERLVSLYSPLICHWCQQARLQPADAEEIGQEVFLAVARNIDTYRHDREGDSFRGWLRTITRNKIKDHHPPPGGKGTGDSDIQQVLARIPAPGGEGGTEDESEDLEKNILYRRAIELIESVFEPRSRRAFWLVINGHPPAQVAADLGMTVAAVYVAKSRILGRLRSEFEGLIHLPGATEAVNAHEPR